MLPKAKGSAVKAEKGKGSKVPKVKAEEEDSEADVSTSAPSRAASVASMPSTGWAVMAVPATSGVSEPGSPPKKKQPTARAALKKAEKPKAAAKFSACVVCQKLPDALPALSLDSDLIRFLDS